MKKLKRCPCGQHPTDVVIMEQTSPANWAWVAGNCCAEWNIEFRSDYAQGEELKQKAIEAWNNADRGGMK